MKTYYAFCLTAVFVIAGAVFAFIGLGVAAALCALGALASLHLAYRAIALQLRTIATGMDLLKAQDFASRLRRVGQPEADRMVDLYNSMIESMKTERLRNREQNKFLSKLIEASPMGIAICSLDEKIEESNAAFRKLASPELLEVLGSLADEEQRTVRPGGTGVLRCSRQYFMDRGFRRPFFLIEPLTDEIVRAETDVFHKIVRTMGHEVNNTLGGVVSVLESMAAMQADDDVCRALDSCRSSCLRLSEFVRGYSDVVKLPEPEPEKTDLGVFVEETLPFLHSLCTGNISIAIEKSDAESTVMLDPVLMQRVLINVVKNAVESIGSRPGHIRLRVDGKTLAVIDDGPGITPEAAQRLFTPFFSTKRPDRGLGLMLVADILRRHNAGFSLATAGGETTFLITFA